MTAIEGDGAGDGKASCLLALGGVGHDRLARSISGGAGAWTEFRLLNQPAQAAQIVAVGTGDNNK